jgi:hypothetical protein
MKPYLLYLLIALSWAPAKAQNNAYNSSGLDSVRSLIQSLPEIQEKDQVYDSITKRVQPIIIKITPPDSTVPLYYVEAGYQGNTRFQPHFYLYVDLNNHMIYIEDWDHGDRTTLDQWRLRRRTAQLIDPPSEH